MNPLERSLIEKAGYDNGWENVVGMEDDGVVLASSRHSGQVKISTLSENGRADFLKYFKLLIING